MSRAEDGATSQADRKQTERLERARSAAREFCRHFGFAPEQTDQLERDPIQKPLILKREKGRVEVFRWLGNGRGAPYVQVELGIDTDELTVFGGFNHREFGPWKPTEPEARRVP